VFADYPGVMFDAQLWPILWRTLQVSGTAVLLSSVVGIPLGLSLGLARGKIATFCRALIYTAMAFPPVVIGLLLYIVLSRSGPLGTLGWLYTPQAMIVAQFILALPFVIGITMAAVAATPKELPAQLQSLGANRWQIRKALLREARFGVMLAVVAAMGRSLSEVGAVLIVGGNIAGETRVLTTAIVLETSKGRFGFALALGATLLGLALLLNLLIMRLPGSRSAYE